MPGFTRRRFLLRGAGFGALVLGVDVLPVRASKVCVGLAGLGVEGSNHLRALSGLDGVRVAALCDPDPQALLAGSRILANSAVLVEDFRRMLDRTDIDLVVIATPRGERMRMIEAAAQAGKHVVTGQPGPPTLKEAARLHDLAKEYPISIQHFPASPEWDSQALIPLLALDQANRVEIQLFGESTVPAAAFDEFEVAARLLNAGLPRRAVALRSDADGFRGLSLSAEIDLDQRKMALHQSRTGTSGCVERRIIITIENGRQTSEMVIDSWCEWGEASRPSATAWCRALATIANGNHDEWASATRYTAVASATVHILSEACRRGEFIWERMES